MWHIHRYSEVERVYAPPKPLKRVSGSVEGCGIVSKLMFGVTTIVSRCCVCGALQTVEVLGDARAK